MAPRPITTLAIFFISFNLFALMLQSTGVSAVLGVNDVTRPCPDDPTQEELREIESCQIKYPQRAPADDTVDTGTSSQDTLFGMYNVLANQVMSVVGVIFPGLNLLQRAGVPGYIIGFLAGLFGPITLIGALSFLRGWGL